MINGTLQIDTWISSYKQCSKLTVKLHSIKPLFSILRQRHLQFNPAFEEVKAKYFRELKKFIGIPNVFRGLGDGTEKSIFPAIIDRNAEGFFGCYQKGEALFTRLSGVLEQYKVGEIDHCFSADVFFFTSVIKMSN